jgi:hypothetical protein
MTADDLCDYLSSETAELCATPYGTRDPLGIPFVGPLVWMARGLPSQTRNTFIVHGVAQTLNNESIRALAAWTSSLPPFKSL